MQRWQLEITFEETRAHLGIETQRQWSNRAIARTRPACSAGSLWSPCWPPNSAHRNGEPSQTVPEITKASQTFSDTLAMAGRHIWREQAFPMSRRSHNGTKPKPALQKTIVYELCNAA